MKSPDDAFRINLNQNLWGLIVSFATLGAAEHLNLRTLYWFGFICATVTLASVAATTLVYTVNYCRNKLK